MTVGKRIRNERESLGIQQSDLAERIGVSKQTLYKYENDIITNIPSDKIEAIALQLDMSPSKLMGWDDSDQETILTPTEHTLINAFRSLNEEGQKKVTEYITDLSENEKYKKDTAVVLNAG